MILNFAQLTAIENGDPVTMAVDGRDCVLIRRHVYLRTHSDFDSQPWTMEEMDSLADEADEIISRGEIP